MVVSYVVVGRNSRCVDGSLSFHPKRGHTKRTLVESFDDVLSQVVILQTWANAGVCGGLCACAVGGTFD